jgi:hypothetical protein
MPLRKKPHKPTYSLFLREVAGHEGHEWDEFLNEKLLH